MKNLDTLKSEKKEKIENALRVLENIKKRKEKQPVLEEGDTPPPEENGKENEDSEEKYVMERLFETLDMPPELSILIPFDDVVSYKEKVNALDVILAGVREKAYGQGLEEGYAGHMPPKEEVPDPAKQIADAMGVKTPSIFRRRR